MIIRCAAAPACDRPAQVSSASERPKGCAADQGEPPQGMRPHRVCEPSEEKEGSVVTAANHCFAHQRESAGRDRHMGTATCPTLGRRCSFSVLPLRWRSWTNDHGGRTVGRAVGATKAEDRAAVATGDILVNTSAQRTCYGTKTDCRYNRFLLYFCSFTGGAPQPAHHPRPPLISRQAAAATRTLSELSGLARDESGWKGQRRCPSKGKATTVSQKEKPRITASQDAKAGAADHRRVGLGTPAVGCGIA